MHKLTHAILLLFHMENLNQSNGHELIEKQGRIHGYPSRVRVGRGSDGNGHWVI